MSTTFLLVCFVSVKESTCETKNVFLFHFGDSFHFSDNQILIFQIFKCHDTISCPSMQVWDMKCILLIQLLHYHKMTKIWTPPPPPPALCLYLFNFGNPPSPATSYECSKLYINIPTTSTHLKNSNLCNFLIVS